MYNQIQLLGSKVTKIVNKWDMEYKMKIKSNEENRNTKSHNLTIGDYVFSNKPKSINGHHHMNQNIIELLFLSLDILYVLYRFCYFPI